MDELKRFEELSAIARSDVPPPVDVREAVMRRIGASRPLAQPLRGFWPLVGAVTVAIAASVVMALETWTFYSEPFSELLCSVGVLQ